MKVHDDHMYHGAALIQVAEHKLFTAINALKTGKKKYGNAYSINDDIALYMKYASKKTKPHDEYVFTFQKQHLNELKSINKKYPKLFLALVCVQDREICCLSYGELSQLILLRRVRKKSKEDQYTVLVTAEPRKAMRVYMNQPGVKSTVLGKPIIIKRNDFPQKIFG